MSVDGGQRIRGYRPSQYGADDAEAEEAEKIRSVNVEVYAQRVHAGLPLFEDAGHAVTLRHARSGLRIR